MIYHIYDRSKVGSKYDKASDKNNQYIDYRDYQKTPMPYPTAVVKEEINSDIFLKFVLKHFNNFKAKLFHVFIIETDTGFFALTDAVMNQFPSLEDREKFAIETVSFLTSLKLWDSEDIVAFLNHSGHFNLKNPTANDSYLLAESFNKKVLCDINGRMLLGKAISCQLDYALSSESRDIKDNYPFEKKRNAKIIVVNDINEGNSIMKSFMLNGKKCMGFVINADIPVILNSRSNLKDNAEAINFLLTRKGKR